MTLLSKERQMTLEELEKNAQQAAGSDWRVTVRLLPDGHTQIRSVRKTA